MSTENPVSSPSSVVSSDPIYRLLQLHARLLQENPYTYFELAYTRQTEWMAWLCSNAKEHDPTRKILARGQAVTPEDACARALEYFEQRAEANR